MVSRFSVYFYFWVNHSINFLECIILRCIITHHDIDGDNKSYLGNQILLLLCAALSESDIPLCLLLLALSPSYGSAPPSASANQKAAGAAVAVGSSELHEV